MNGAGNPLDTKMNVDVKRLEDFVSRHPTCAICGNRDYDMAGLDGNPTSLWLHRSATGNSAPNVYALTCNKCGDVRLISRGSVPRASDWPVKSNDYA